MKRLKVGVIGVGHLGKEHARILSGMANVELVGVVDANPNQAEMIAQRCGTRAFAAHQTLLPLIDAAVVVVPTLHHFAVARDFLSRGIPLLIEKPLANDVSEAEELVALAAANKAVLQVGHIERFNPAFEELLRRPLKPKYVSCERFSGFSGRSIDIGVVLDLMIHDLDLLLSLVRAPVRSVDALGAALLGGHEDMAHARLVFENGCVANLSASRVHPIPTRRMNIFGPEGWASVDFGKRHLTLMQPARHLREGRVNVRRMDSAALGLLKTELFTRHLETQELDCSNDSDQLTNELLDFIKAVQTKSQPRVDGVMGRDAVALAGQILESMRQHEWEGETNGPIGPWDLPRPRGQLFFPAQAGQEAA
jgi:predicted dehydrogenase